MKRRILVLMMAALGSTAAMATTTVQTESVWRWSNSGQYYFYRDNDGRVHYSDGSVSGPDTVWTDNGKVVYSANSKGPADKTGVWAIQAPKIDESKVGPAPKTPPVNAVLTYPDSSKPTFGPAPTGPQYIVPEGPKGPSAPAIGGYVLNPSAATPTVKAAPRASASGTQVKVAPAGQPQSGTYIQGGNGTQIYYYQRSDGANVYVSP